MPKDARPLRHVWVAALTPPGMHVEIVGTGPPVVLTHGFADDPSTFDAQLPALAGRRVRRWDVPGHGRSSVGRGSVVTWHGVGVARSDDRPGRGRPCRAGRPWPGRLPRSAAPFSTRGVAGLVLIATGPGFRVPAKRDASNEFLTSCGDRHGIDPAVRGIAEQPDSVVLDRLGTIDVPVLVVVGADDVRYHAGSRVIAEACRRAGWSWWRGPGTSRTAPTGRGRAGCSSSTWP